MSVANDTGYLAGGVIEVIAADAIVQLGKASVTRNLVTVKSAPHADTITWSVFNDGTHKVNADDVAATAEGTVTPSSYLGSSKKTATMDVYSLNVPIYDEAVDSNADNPTAAISEVIGNAIALKIDNLLNANFDNFSNSVGTSTTGMKLSDLFSGLAVIEALKSNYPLNLVAHAAQLWGAYGLFTDTAISTSYGGTPAVADVILSNGFVSKLAGIGIYNSNEISETSSARKAGLFTKEAIGWGFVGNEVRLEAERQSTYLRTMYVASGSWGTCEIRDAAGVEVHSKTTA